MGERGESTKELREIQGFREWGKDAFDAGRFGPAWDAGMDTQERMGRERQVPFLLAERAR